MITVVDYGMGNLRSLLNAFEYLGASIELQSTPEGIASASKLVIPGVGAFGDAMNNLRQRNLVSALNEAVIQKKVPVLGICLGMQLMANFSEEHGEHQGLGWIPGRVIKLSPKDPDLKVPHVGWNSIEISSNTHSIFTNLKSEAHLSFYFVHSYHYAADNNQHVLAFSNHGQQFAAVVGDSNIIACQFHPEKSQDNGLQLLTNFIEWSGC